METDILLRMVGDYFYFYKTVSDWDYFSFECECCSVGFKFLTFYFKFIVGLIGLLHIVAIIANLRAVNIDESNTR